MTIYNLIENEHFTCVSKGEDKEISGCFCGDFLSFVMGYAKDIEVWFTIMGNINSVAVASLNDIPCIVLCNNIKLNEDALKKASEENITVLYTSLPVFEAACLVSDLIK